MENLYTIAYVSRGRIPEDSLDRELRRIIDVSQSKNAEEEITGVLITTGCHFLQVLEGPIDAVRALTAKLLLDPRHSDMKVVDEYTIAERHYPDWSMRYAGLTTYAVAFFSRLHLGPTSSTDMGIVRALIERATV